MGEQTIEDVVLRLSLRDKLIKPLQKIKTVFGKFKASINQTGQLMNTLSPQFSNMTNNLNRQGKAISKLQRPMSMTDAISKTTWTDMNSQIAALGNKSANIMPKLKNSFKGISTTGMEQLSGAYKGVGESMKELIVPTETPEMKTEGIIKSQKEMAKTSKSMGKELQQVGWERLRDKTDGFFGSLGVGLPVMKGIQENTDGYRTKLGRLGNTIRMATHGLRGFRMEMLGVMFFGMMLQKAFLGLLRPVMEVYGVFELWRIMLMIMFLPVMAQLMPYFLRFIDFFLELDPKLQLAIGWFVIFGVVLGFLLYIFGTFALGIGSIILALGPLGLGLTKVGAATKLLSSVFKIFSGSVAIIAAIIVAIIVGMVLAWKENFADMQDWIAMVWEGIENIFSGSIKITTGLFGAFLALISGDTEKFKNSMSLIWQGIKQLLFGLVQFIVGAFISIGIGVLRALIGILKILVGFGTTVLTWVDGLTGGLLTKAKKFYFWLMSIIIRGLRKLSEIPGFGWIGTFMDIGENVEEKIKNMFADDMMKDDIESIGEAVEDMGDTTSVSLKDTKNNFLTELQKMGVATDEGSNNINNIWGDGMFDMIDITQYTMDENFNVFAGGLNKEYEALSAHLTRMNNARNGKSTSSWAYNLHDNVYAASAKTAMMVRDLGLDDFVWRPGSSPVKINPNDTLVGTKGGTGMGSGSVVINQTNNISVSDKAEFERIIDDNNKRVVEDLRRMVKVPA